MKSESTISEMVTDVQPRTTSVQVARYLQYFLFFNLCGLAITVFIARRDTGPFNLFSLVCLAILFIWRYAVEYEPCQKIPKTVFWNALLFIFIGSVSAFLSDKDQHFGFILTKYYKFILLAGLLYSVPFEQKYRNGVTAVFFASAGLAGLYGIIQYVFIGKWRPWFRPAGLSENPNFYAGILTVVCISLIILLFLDKSVRTSKIKLIFSLTVLFLASIGIVLSQSRSMWVALLVSCAASLFLKNRRMAGIFVGIFIIVFALLIINSSHFQRRTFSIVDSFFTRNYKASTDIRVELWKGSLLLFKKYPLLGAGLGDFKPEIQQLIKDGQLKHIENTWHAHSIYLQVLATRGILGFTILLTLLTSIILWSLKLIRQTEIGGYVIFGTTLLIIVGGLTDNYLEFPRVFAVYCLTVGLIGPYSSVVALKHKRV